MLVSILLELTLSRNLRSTGSSLNLSYKTSIKYSSVSRKPARNLMKANSLAKSTKNKLLKKNS